MQELAVRDDRRFRQGLRLSRLLDSVTGPQIGVLSVAGTGGFDTLSVQSTSVTPTSGHHRVFLVASGGQPGFGNIDYFSFNRAGR
ncbi:carbohydrate-binding protein [Streptomyces sp. NPDC006333]|uniref:carbohydrate-binding protein n=1 Tax=Streptomyces sp. NPDC006333 TaxID=3156753 RepID=UPI0033A50F34